jgi:hypothetical protein
MFFKHLQMVILRHLAPFGAKLRLFTTCFSKNERDKKIDKVLK